MQEGKNELFCEGKGIDNAKSEEAPLGAPVSKPPRP